MIILLICFSLPIIGSCINPPESNNTKPVFSKILEEEGIDSYNIPVFLVKLALNFSDESESIMPLFKGSRSISLAILDDHRHNYLQSYKRICNSLELSSYSDLVNIIDSDSRITIKALLHESIIRELVVLIHDKDNFVAISMTGRINPRDIAEAITKLNKSKKCEL